MVTAGWAVSAGGSNPRNLSGVKRAQKNARAWGRFLSSRRARAKRCGQIHAAVDRLPQLGEAGKLVARHGAGFRQPAFPVSLGGLGGGGFGETARIARVGVCGRRCISGKARGLEISADGLPPYRTGRIPCPDMP